MRWLREGKRSRRCAMRELMKGNVAMAEAAIRAGVEAYFGA